MSRFEDAQTYPLAWPEGWPRTPDHKRLTDHPFKASSMVSPREAISFDRARRLLREELGRLGAKQVTLSTNIPLRGDGEPYANAARRRMDHPGVAIYFMLKGKQMVMAQDRYWDVAANLRSLALAIEAMRALDRHGGGTMMERAFAGFTALPAPDGAKPKRPWWTVLNYPADPDDRLDLSVEEVDARFRTLAKRRHPDVDGGSVEAFQELQEARDDAVREIGG